MKAKDVALIRDAVTAIRDREHEITVVLDDNAKLLDRIVELIDAHDDLRIDTAIHAATVRATRGLRVVAGDAS